MTVSGFELVFENDKSSNHLISSKDKRNPSERWRSLLPPLRRSVCNQPKWSLQMAVEPIADSTRPSVKLGGINSLSESEFGAKNAICPGTREHVRGTR